MEICFQGGMVVHLESLRHSLNTSQPSKYILHCSHPGNHRMGDCHRTGTSIFGCSVAARFVLAVQRRDSQGVGPTAENSLLKIFLYCV